MIKWLWSVISLTTASLLLVYAVLYFLQDAMLFHPQPLDANVLHWARKNFPGAELKLPVANGVTLHGWLYLPPGQGPHPLLLLFGGNADEITSYLSVHKELAGWALGAFNYRGYGFSQGKPTQKALFADALSVYDTLAKHAVIDSKRIVAFGRSLGTGVAVYLAAHRPLRGVVLVSPYDSILALAQEVHPYAPVNLLLKHPFNSLALAPKIKVPMMALVGEEDTLISPVHSQRLVDAWGGSAMMRTIPAVDHDTIMDNVKRWQTIHRFLLSLEGSKQHY
ncbi:hypothetical protein TI03_01770 [Achromatium sp. WMS1]|nr:hypothetical protein TI03_01770 [Achromatium sp. WMS1]